MIIDDRAGSRVLAAIPPLNSISTLGRMEFGDVMFSGNGPDGPVLVGVEVKSLSDLLSSELTGRLAGRQLQGMLDTYDHPWLLAHGTYRAGTDGLLEVRQGKSWRKFKVGSRPVPYAYLTSFIIEIIVSGVAYWRVYDVDEAALWLYCLHRWWQKPWAKHKAMRKFDRSGDRALLPSIPPDRLAVARVAADLPAIGWERGVAAAARFNTILDMINATEREWAEVPGIGKVIAESVVKAVRGER